MGVFLPRVANPLFTTRPARPALGTRPLVMPPLHAMMNPVYTNPLYAALAARQRSGFGRRP